MKILLIDDDTIVNYIHQSMLSKMNSSIEFINFLNCEDALNWLTANQDIKIDCILLDINLPVSDGWDFLDYLSDLQLNHAVYIVTSSIAESDRIKSTKYTSIKGFLIKPITVLDLESILSTLP